MTADKRPTPRTRPTPAPETPDPAIPHGERETPSPAAPLRRRKGAQPTVQLNSRVLPILSDLVDEVVAETGWSKREVLENALRKTYPKQLRALEERDKQES